LEASCRQAPVTICVKEFRITTTALWCLEIQNTFLNDQYFDVVLSFTQSVFVAGSNRKDSNQPAVEPYSLKKSNLISTSVNGNNKKRNFRRSNTLRLDHSL
ncbi:18955_t:CDS:1, partial [Funneliformis geosporum]